MKYNQAQLNNMLFNAAWAGDNAVIISLLAQGADINSRHTELQATSLYAAVKNNQPDTAQIVAGGEKEFFQQIHEAEYEMKYVEICGEV